MQLCGPPEQQRQLLVSQLMRIARLSASDCAAVRSTVIGRPVEDNHANTN